MDEKIKNKIKPKLTEKLIFSIVLKSIKSKETHFDSLTPIPVIPGQISSPYPNQQIIYFSASHGS